MAPAEGRCLPPRSTGRETRDVYVAKKWLPGPQNMSELYGCLCGGPFSLKIYLQLKRAEKEFMIGVVS